MMSAPTHQEIAAALHAGINVRLGVPTTVRCADGVAIADLAAVARGDPDPWFIAGTDATPSSRRAEGNVSAGYGYGADGGGGWGLNGIGGEGYGSGMGNLAKEEP